MTDKQVVCTIEPYACIEKGEDSYWAVRKHPAGSIIGAGNTSSRAWHKARMNLFENVISEILSEIPVSEK